MQAQIEVIRITVYNASIVVSDQNAILPIGGTRAGTGLAVF
jgi:hypothetical protein